MKKTLLSLMSAAFLFGVPAMANAEDALTGKLDFCYSSFAPGTKLDAFGVQGTGQTDVAMMIPRDLAGAKLTAIQIPVSKKYGTDYMEKLNAWASTKLIGTETTTFIPDREKVDITTTVKGNLNLNSSEYEYITVNLENPVEVPAAGLYVGYSFDVNELPKDAAGKVQTLYGLLVDVDYAYRTNGFMMHYMASGSNPGYSSLKWTDVGFQYGCVSIMKAILEDVKGNQIQLSPSSYPLRMGKEEENMTITLPVKNVGFNGINSVDYDFEMNGKKESLTYTFDATDAIAAGGLFGTTSSIEIPIPAGLAQASYPYKVNITKINGADVTAQNLSASNYLKVYDKLPVKRPLLEENTGTKCPYCTRGYYALEVMKRLYPDMIAISYHNSWQGTDPMSVISPPYTASGNPAARTDRMYNWDDFDMDAKTAGMEALYLAGFNKDNRSGADISVSAEWADDTKTVLKATAKVVFPVEEEMRYRLDIALVEDGMTGKTSAWTQSNGYAGFGDLFSEPEWDKFAKSSSVKGLEYDDIFVGGASNNMKGVLGSLPTNIEAGTEYELTREFIIDQLYNDTKARIVQDVNKLKVVAMVIYSPENVVSNAVQCFVPGYSGVEEISSAVEPVYPVAYYDLTGRQVRNPENGIFIVRMSDGSTVKRVIR